MTIKYALQQLAVQDSKGIKVFNRADLASLFDAKTAYELNKIFRLLIERNVLQRVTRGIYVNQAARSSKRHLIEEIACTLRRGHFNYVSLESILSEFGVISQIMISRITVMTTGASGAFVTPYGTIEFTHTKRSLESLRNRTIQIDARPLPIATKEAGVADLKRVGRNIDLIDSEEL